MPTARFHFNSSWVLESLILCTKIFGFTSTNQMVLCEWNFSTRISFSLNSLLGKTVWYCFILRLEKALEKLRRQIIWCVHSQIAVSGFFHKAPGATRRHMTFYGCVQCSVNLQQYGMLLYHQWKDKKELSARHWKDGEGGWHRCRCRSLYKVIFPSHAQQIWNKRLTGCNAGNIVFQLSILW